MMQVLFNALKSQSFVSKLYAPPKMLNAFSAALLQRPIRYAKTHKNFECFKEVDFLSSSSGLMLLPLQDPNCLGAETASL